MLQLLYVSVCSGPPEIWMNQAYHDEISPWAIFKQKGIVSQKGKIMKLTSPVYYLITFHLKGE